MTIWRILELPGRHSSAAPVSARSTGPSSPVTRTQSTKRQSARQAARWCIHATQNHVNHLRTTCYRECRKLGGSCGLRGQEPVVRRLARARKPASTTDQTKKWFLANPMVQADIFFEKATSRGYGGSSPPACRRSFRGPTCPTSLRRITGTWRCTVISMVYLMILLVAVTGSGVLTGWQFWLMSRLRPTPPAGTEG